MVLVIALAWGAKVKIAPAKAVITSHFVRMTFSLKEVLDQSIQPLCKQPHGT
jgi:hypothetical protein